MPGSKATLPPEVRRFSGLYRFIDPERFVELGIDPEDVPLGTYPAEDHPPFLPDRLGGNAYGLGLFEQTALAPAESRLMEAVDLKDQSTVAGNYRGINDIFKRLGLLVRYSSLGQPFYLIPRHYVAHYLVEVRAKADEIIVFLAGLMNRRLRESLKVGLLATQSELLTPELQGRMPHLDFTVLDTLAEITSSHRPLDALVLVGDPQQFITGLLSRQGLRVPQERRGKEDLGHFMAASLYDLLAPEGELMCLAERPLGSSRQTLKVRFKSLLEFKRFLMFSHVYRTRRRYTSASGTSMEVARFDFDAFLTGMGLYHETMEGLLEGKSLARMEPAEIDRLHHQDLPLPRGSHQKLTAAWKRWFSTFFQQTRMDSVLPAVQRREWESRYQIRGDFPDILLAYQGVRRRPSQTLAQVEQRINQRRMAGCDRKLLADYKDSFEYVGRVIDILEQVRQGSYTVLPGLELSRLRKPFETLGSRGQLKDVRRLMDTAPRLLRLQERLNPAGIKGQRTPVLDNLEKLSLMGVEEGALLQLYLMVLGHSTMSRVTFGKLPETSLAPLTDLANYENLEEAVTVLRLYRLLSVAEAAAASDKGLSPGQVREMFSLYDKAIHVISDPELTWEDVIGFQISRVGGVQAKATRKMLKLFNYFEYLDDWRRLELAGPREKEALAGFDPAKEARIGQVIELIHQERRFVEHFFADDSSARPFFFRALLNSELHGTGRLLPRLGTATSFTLLWICIHASHRRLVNFNPLLAAANEPQLNSRLEKLRKALAAFTPEQLTPNWLAGLRRLMTGGGEAYLGASGLYLTVEPETGALAPHFLDPGEDLAQLSEDLDQTVQNELARAPAERMDSMDRSLNDLTVFMQAQSPLRGQRLAQMSRDLAKQKKRFDYYVLDQLLCLPDFAENLDLLVNHCPHTMDRLLPQPAVHALTRRRLSAAAKLSSLEQRRLEGFQDMQLSHEMALAEFGAAAAGIVGVTPVQFQRLTASLAQLMEKHLRLARLMMMAVLCYSDDDPRAAREWLASSQLLSDLRLDRTETEDLDFLLQWQDIFRQVVFGEVNLPALQPVLDCGDPPLVEALFLLSVVCGAARHEGFLTEDLLERYFRVLDIIRRLTISGTSAARAHQDQVWEAARRWLALEHYQEIQTGQAPTASLQHLLDSVRLPQEPTEKWRQIGLKHLGLDRLLKQRGLILVDALDLLMLNTEVPVKYIYRLKGLRSVGVTHFERDLYEARRLYRGLTELPEKVQDYLLSILGDGQQQVRLAGFEQAAMRLTYTNQIRLMMVGLAAARMAQEQASGPVTINFQPLARLMERKFELVNELVTALDPLALVNRPAAVKQLLDAKEGLSLSLDQDGTTVSLTAADPLRQDRKLEAVKRASSVDKLKRLYHRELKKLELTGHASLDYQQRLEDAFQRNLSRLGEDMLERVRRRMAAESDLGRLEELFRRAWEEGLELPLSLDRQQSLRDLWEMSAERIRGQMLADIRSRLAAVGSFKELEELWKRTRSQLKAQGANLSQDFRLEAARLFDRRAQDLRRMSQADL